MSRTAVILVVLLAVAARASGAETAGVSAPTAPAAASFAKQGLVLTDLAGNQTALDSLLAKGPVVLNFWATWCGPCRTEMPYLSKVYNELGPKGVGFAAVSLDRGLSREVLEKFVKGRGFVLPLYRDDSGALARKFGVAAIPTTVLLKPSGEVAHLARGFRPGDEVLLRKKIEEVVAAVAAGAVSQHKN
ncbi:MAG: redoxin domain-containing protein [bacterium]